MYVLSFLVPFDWWSHLHNYVASKVAEREKFKPKVVRLENKGCVHVEGEWNNAFA